MDSTIIHQECIDELASEYGVGHAVSKITKKSMNGEITFEESLRQRVSLLKGMKVHLIDKVLRNRITYAAGADALVICTEWDLFKEPDFNKMKSLMKIFFVRLIKKK